jgi:hypothetical protein
VFLFDRRAGFVRQKPFLAKATAPVKQIARGLSLVFHPDFSLDPG